MASNPVGALILCVVWGSYAAYVGSQAIQEHDIPRCDDVISVLTGCGSTWSAFFSMTVFGTVPGAPDWLNAAFAIIGLSARGIIVWAVAEMFRGV